MRDASGESYLAKVFGATERDPRIDFFMEKMTPAQLEILVDMRERLFEGGEMVKQLTPHQYRLQSPGKTIVKSGPRGTSYNAWIAGEELSCFSAFLNLALGGEKSVSHWTLWGGSPREKPQISYKDETVAFLLNYALPLLVFLLLAIPARGLDQAREALIASNGASGACVLVKDGCVSGGPMDGGSKRFDCYKPKTSSDICDSTVYFISLSIVTFIGMLANHFHHTAQKTKKRTLQYMQSILDNAKYDSLLDHILNKDVSHINWAETITVNKKPCTARTLALLLLICFDDRMYQHVFPQLLGKLCSEDTDFELSHESIGTLCVTRDSVSSKLKMR